MKSFTKKSLSLLALSMTGALAFGSFVGCSGDDDDNNNNNGNGTDASTTDAAKGDGSTGKTDGSTDSGPGSSDAGDAGDAAGPAFTYTGQVSLGQSALSAGGLTVTNVNASASFSILPTGFANATSTEINANCKLVLPIAAVDAGTPDAGFDAGDADAAPALPPESGTITLTGGSLATGGIALKVDSTTGDYTAVNQTTPAFSGGASIVFTSVGDTSSVPAFTSTVLAPSDITVSPAAAAGVYTFDRMADKTFTWTGGGAGTVSISVSSTSSANGTRTVECSFPATAATGVIPSVGGLAKLEQAGTTGVTGNVIIVPSNVATATAGLYTVTNTVRGTTAVDMYSASN